MTKDRAKQHTKRLYNWLSKLDKTQNQLLHEAESNDINKKEGYELFERIRDVRKCRRNVKKQISWLQSKVDKCG